MAIAFIRELRNHHAHGSLRIRVQDNNRHPRVDGVEYGADKWLDVKAPDSEGGYTSKLPDNMAVPWSYGGAQRLYIECTVNGKVRTMSAEISGDGGWDYIVLRDHELRQIGRMEIGSLGDAPGVNHSWWAVVLHANGRLEWVLFERQGARRDDLVQAGAALGKVVLDLVLEAEKAAIRLLPELLAV